MIQETMTHVCRACESTSIVKNGTHRGGNAQYHCKDCGTYRVLKPKPASWETHQQTVLQAGLERCSLRGVERIFALPRQTVVRWSSTPIQKLPEVAATLLPASADSVLERNEVWSVVLKKAGIRWVWTALCRRTRQIVACALGDRSKATCLRVWKVIPDADQPRHSFSDFWTASQHVFPAKTQQGVGKETEETAHMERWNKTLRQRMCRYVRQTFSFSQSAIAHQIFTRWFSVQ